MQWQRSVEMEIRKINRRRSRSSDYAEVGHFTFLFCRGRQIYDARAQLLFYSRFYSLNLLFSHVLVVVRSWYVGKPSMREAWEPFSPWLSYQALRKKQAENTGWASVGSLYFLGGGLVSAKFTSKMSQTNTNKEFTMTKEVRMTFIKTLYPEIEDCLCLVLFCWLIVLQKNKTKQTKKSKREINWSWVQVIKWQKILNS